MLSRSGLPQHYGRPSSDSARRYRVDRLDVDLNLEIYSFPGAAVPRTTRAAGVTRLGCLSVPVARFPGRDLSRIKIRMHFGRAVIEWQAFDNLGQALDGPQSLQFD